MARRTASQRIIEDNDRFPLLETEHQYLGLTPGQQGSGAAQTSELTVAGHSSIMVPKGRNEAMATLNIKGIPDGLYRKLQARAKRERRSVAQEVIYLVSQAVEAPARLSILELKGLGKEVWRGVDPGGHVAAERRSWE